MTRLAPAWALAWLACASGCGCRDEERRPVPEFVMPAEGEAALASDDRIAWLLAPCSIPEAFLADTGDPVAILVSKLSSGQLDPLRLARTELSAMGEAALSDLRRYAEREMRDPSGAPRLLNAIGIVGAMETDAGRDILLSALAHPQDTVRLEAIRGLGVHARPEDYDRLAALVPVSSDEALAEIGQALVAADRGRAEDDFVAWLSTPREGTRERPSLWLGAPERLCDTARPETLEGFREIWPDAQGETRFYLAAAVARAGDEEALLALRTSLRSENPLERSLAVLALDRVGLTREIVPVLTEDRDEKLRGIVAGKLAALPPSAETNAWLSKGTLDRARSVRLVCLAALAERGDAEAREQGLAMLEGARSDLEYGITVLRRAWERDEALARRTFDLLVRLRKGESAPARVEEPSLDRAIAQIPLLDATRFLFEKARSKGGDVDGLPAHRWYLMQAGNTGALGRAWLRERWSEEVDPAWRVDIAMASSYDKNEESREFLLRVVEDERTTPLEILHAANLVVHHGPTAIVAPRLKRVALRVADPRVRPALNCLLGQWYSVGP